MSRTRRWLPSRPRRQHATVAVAEAYRAWAPSYGESPNELQQLEQASLCELLPELTDRILLDVGCGRGRIGRLARSRGARRAIELDATLRMLALGPAETRLRLAAEATRLSLRDACCDVAVAGLVLGHVADLAAALGELSRVLRHDGVLLVSDFHPYAHLHGWQRTFVDPATGREAAIESHPHLLADYFTVFERLGWVVDALREPTWEGIPVAFALRARRRGGGS
ncbi:MAG: class I SAM-dependent methyltransferase [Thermoanaerobaculia bacterium]|nr:class I SAM-dependent methyltransferase [Thermoanaerobaculia bacterium]